MPPFFRLYDKSLVTLLANLLSSVSLEKLTSWSALISSVPCPWLVLVSPHQSALQACHLLLPLFCFCFLMALSSTWYIMYLLVYCLSASMTRTYHYLLSSARMWAPLGSFLCPLLYLQCLRVKRYWISIEWIKSGLFKARYQVSPVLFVCLLSPWDSLNYSYISQTSEVSN